ncbi:MAG TPA: hypothetical protein VF618_16460 [Thermoanaerobaculia bacterium]
MRYLWHAFFAKPDIPLVGFFPWNAVAVAAAAVAGWFDPSIWATAGVAEFIFLFTLASNNGFQRSIDERRVAETQGETEEARDRLLRTLGGAARQRYVKLEQKRQKLEKVYRDVGSDDLLFDSNLAALKRLTWLYLKLLAAQRTLINLGPRADTRELQTQIAALEAELPAAAATVRESKEATLRLLRERRDNIDHREQYLAEIDSDLARIEAQIDLALDEASLRGRPVALSSDVKLTSSLLDNIESDTVYVSRELE